MPQDDVMLKIVFENSGETRQAALSDLVAALTGCLDHFGVKPLVDESFAAVIQNGDGRTKMARLLDACGCPEDPEGFFSRLLPLLGRAPGVDRIEINGVVLPHLMLMAVPEVVLPAQRCFAVQTVEQLEKEANIRVAPSDRGDMQQVIDTYPVRLSMHTIRQMRVSRNVAYQYLPFIQELDAAGHTNTWIGQFHKGLPDQMYQNRGNMACAIDSLMEIDHVHTLRLATRAIAYYPHMFLADDEGLLNYLKRKNLTLQERGKRMGVATHFIHPDEISSQNPALSR